jgi:hypothetical protein
MHKLLSIFLAFMVTVYTSPLFATSQIKEDTVVIGSPSSTATKKIKFKNSSHEIRANTTNSKLEYTNDGVNYKAIGSGSGSGGSSSGVNLITNDGFEDGISSGWTSSGGTFSLGTYTNAIDSDTKYATFISTAAGQYIETTAAVIPDSFSGGGCQADFKKYNTTTSTAFKIQALDSSSNVLAEQTLSSGSWIKSPSISFACPTVGATVKLRLISLLAATINADKAYIGSNQNLVYISQAKLIGSCTITPVAAQTHTSTSFSVFPAVASITSTITGQALAPSTNITGCRFATLPAGDYYIVYDGNYGSNSSGVNSIFSMSDGATNAIEQTACVGTAGGYGCGSSTSRFSYTTTQSNITFQPIAKILTSGTVYISASPQTIKVFYYPASSDVAALPEQASWLIDANIGGANISHSTSAITSYTEMTNSTLDLVLNTSKGSANANIACASGTASSGSTCTSANESIGISFIPPYAGQFEACFDYTSEITMQSASIHGEAIYYQLALTSDTSSAIIQEGGVRTGHQASRESGNEEDGAPFKTCGAFTFSDTSMKTIRLMHEKTATVASLIFGDRDGSNGQRDIHITVRPVLSSFNRPILLDTPIITSSYYISTNASVGANVQINYDAKEFDIGCLVSCVTTGAGVWKFTVPYGGDGLYDISITPYGSAATNLRVFKNGSAYKWIDYYSSSLHLGGNSKIKLVAGDYIDIRPDAAITHYGGTLSSTTAISLISITRVGK